MHKIFQNGVCVLSATLWLSFLAPATARLGTQYQMVLGNPDGAAADATSRTKYLIGSRSQYAISYNDDTHQANWVGWSYSLDDDGTQARTDAWQTEELLPSGYLRIGTSTFGTSYGISWDRGHMTPSADRTTSYNDNAVTFRMSNIIPQAAANNQGLWADFETYCRGLTSGNKEVLIMSGPAAFTGNRIGNSMSVPGSVWKIAVVVPDAGSPTPANQRITASARVIAILTPNVSSGLGTWQSYITSVEQIEEVTGFNFFTAVDPSVAIYLKNVVDTGTAPNTPTVITTFSPTLGAPGTAVSISGYNFAANSTVQFNGVAASSVTYVNANQLTAVVPAGATTGIITVTGPGGSDISYENFTVTGSSSTPTINVSPATISGLSATEGSAGAAQIYAVTGANLTAAVTVVAPANFEVGADGTTFGPSIVLSPAIDGSLGTQVYVRIKAGATVGAVGGDITHTSTGAATRTVAVSGTVVSSAPQITLSSASLTGFAALQGNTSSSKSYTVSGANLTGSVTITAPSGYELSLDNSTFAASRSLAPVGGSIAATAVYVRLASSAPLGSVTGSVTHAGGSAATQNLAVSGTVSTPGGSSEVYWNFQTASPTSGVPAPLTVGDIVQGNNNGTTTLLTTTSASSGYTGASGGNNAGAAARVGVLNTAASGSAYFEFTVTPADGSSFTFSGFSFGCRSTSTGPQAYALRSSADGYASDITADTLTNNSTWTLKTKTGLAQTHSTAVTYRLYGYNGTGTATASTANWRIDDLKLTVSTSTTAAPAPVITVAGPETATALQVFSYQIQANNSPTSYAASGLPAGLTINTATGAISGTPTTPGTYTVGLIASNASGDGTATLTINVQTNPNAPVITSTLVAYGQINSPFSYQITATNSPSSYTALNLPAGLGINTVTGLIEGTPTAGGTTSATITAVNDFGSDSRALQIIVRVPTLSLSPSTLVPFAANAGFTSATQSYSLSGTQLTGPVTVSAPQYFEISTDGSNFVPELVLTPAADESLSCAIIVRLAATAPPGLVAGAISHSGSGATPKYLEISGTVSTVEPTLNVSTANLAPFSTIAGTASASQTYEISGASLGGQVTVTAPVGFEVGSSEANFGPAVVLTPVNGALAPTAIYVRVRSDAAAGNYAANITHSGGGAAQVVVGVSGVVAAPSGPPIVATSGGSAYVSTAYSYTIQTDGTQAVTSYSALGLPAGLSVNATNGVISGTPASAGTYNLTLRATGAQGTSSKPYTLRVIASGEQPTTPTVVVNKYNDSTTDRVELLVTGDSVQGPPVDLRGMIVKDFNTNMGADTGGKYIFNNHPLWANVKAGTLIVLAAGNTLPEDVDASDFVLSVNLANATYFTQESGGFDIGTIDMVMIKPAGMQPDGVAGGMHALAAGSAGVQYNAFTGRKVRSSNSLSGSRGYFCLVSNGNKQLSDFYISNGAQIFQSAAFGSGNNSNNTSYIGTLRALDQDGPAITVLGSNPANVNRGSSYSDAGATAFDSGDNQAKTVTTTGTVNTSVAGDYTITYTATDSKGNVGTATRTVNVLPPASTPPTVATAAATSIGSTSATINGSVSDEGSSAVTARGFVYSSSVSATLEIGASGTVTASAGSGTGDFAAAPTELSPGTVYYFRSFATNTTGISYGQTLTFRTLKAEPLQHAGDFAEGTVTISNIAAVWTAAEADGYLLLVSSGAMAEPTDGMPVSDDTDVSDGAGAINLAGAATSYGGFTGFAPGQTYTFRIFPFNNSGAAIDYKTTGAPAFTAALLTTPTLQASGAPAPLTTTYGTPSTATTFAVSGLYLTNTVEISAPPGFEISEDNTNFSGTLSLTPVSGTLASTAIYLRLAATATVGGSYNAQSVLITSGTESATVATAAIGNAVAPKELSVTGISAADKVYDGTAQVQIVGEAVYDGLVNSESFAVGGEVTWAFPDKSAGTGKILARVGSFAAPSSNYTIPLQPVLAANIAAREVGIIGAVVAAKTYDGTTAATIQGATLDGTVAGDDVSLSGGGAFQDANAGAGKPVVAAFVLTGSDAANYTLVQPSLTGTINKAEQTITFDALPSKSTGDAPFQIVATASSGLPVGFSSSKPAVATIDGSTITVVSAGSTIITATQGGDGNHNAAAPVARELVVVEAPLLIAGWDFQTTTNGGTAAAATNAPLVYAANFGSGSLHLDGANGSSAWIAAPATGGSNQVTAFAGTLSNAAPGFATNTSGSAALALVAATSNSANGQSLVLKFGMAGRKNLSVSYATRGTASGFTTHAWSYSTNASNWTEVSVQTGRTNTNYSAIMLPVITNVDGASEVFMRLTVSGATSATGNNRLDNIQVTATAATTADIIPPVITLNGDAAMTVSAGSVFSDPGATATDDIDGAVAVNVSGSVDTDIPGSYILTYSAQDAAGNTASATRTVAVVDNAPPIVTLIGDAAMTVSAGSVFNDPGATATDNIDGAIAVNVSGSVDTGTPGSYILTYSAQDAAGNTASATRSVTVVDNTPPVVTLVGANPLLLPVGSSFSDPGATAADNVDGAVAVQPTGTVDTAVRGIYTLTYTAADAAGNIGIATRSVIVQSAAVYALETEYGLTGESAALSADADKDGIANVVEYALGSDPSGTSGARPQTATAVVSGALQYSAVVRETDNELVVVPQTAAGLASVWTTNGVVEMPEVDQTGVPGGFRRRVWQVPSPGPSGQFIRLNVIYP